MKVREIAVKEAICADQNSTIAEVASLMKRHNIGAMPVCIGNQLIGMLTDRDIVTGCIASGLDPKSCVANQVMTINPASISPDMTVEDAARVMAKNQVRRLPVVEAGELVGMLSLGDMAMASCDNSLVADTLRKVSSATHSVPVCA